MDLALVPVALAAVACALALDAPPGAPVADGAPTQGGAAAECDPRLKPLAFLAGSWCMSQPKGAVIQEHWTEPRGDSVVAMFRRVLGSGQTPFYEFTQIVAEKGRVVLRQIHVHGDFDADPRRAKPMVLRLVDSSESHAVFEPVAPPEESHAGDLQRITYRRVDAGTLLLRVESTPPKAGDAQGAKDAAGKPDPAPAQVLEFRMTPCAG